MTNHLKQISDPCLLTQFEKIVSCERKATADVIIHIAEIYRRRLYAKEGYSSLFSYLKEKFHYSGSGAYRRIQAAKLSVRYPEIIEHLVEGRLNLTSVSLIEPHLRVDNAKVLIEKVIGKTKEEIEYVISALLPATEFIHHKDTIRRLPIVRTTVSPADVKSNEEVSAAAGLLKKEREVPRLDRMVLNLCKNKMSLLKGTTSPDFV